MVALILKLRGLKMEGVLVRMGLLVLKDTERDGE